MLRSLSHAGLYRCANAAAHCARVFLASVMLAQTLVHMHDPAYGLMMVPLALGILLAPAVVAPSRER